MPEPSKKPRLAAAAEALIEAASLETDAMTQKRLTESLDSLKASFADNLSRTIKTMESSNDNFNAKINTLNQHVVSVKADIGTLKDEISAMKQIQQDDRKDKRIERALKLVHLESFTYYDDKSRKQSSDLAKSTLEWFLYGRGLFIDGLTMEDLRYNYGNNQTEKASSEQAFRDKFKNQIKSLIGKEPRVYKKDDGRYVIHYE